MYSKCVEDANLVVFYIDGAGGKSFIRMKEKKVKEQKSRLFEENLQTFNIFPIFATLCPPCPNPNTKTFYLWPLFLFCSAIFQALERDNLPAEYETLWKSIFL